MQVGDRVIWRSARGGYAFIQSIAAVVERIGPKRIQIRVAQRCAGVWQMQYRWVEPEALRPRHQTVPAVDEIVAEEEKA